MVGLRLMSCLCTGQNRSSLFLSAWELCTKRGIRETKNVGVSSSPFSPVQHHVEVDLGFLISQTII